MRILDEGDENAAMVRAEAGRLEREGRLGQCRAFMQHGDTSVYAHVCSVALVSLRFADALERRGVQVDRTALVRGALLHDYFLYDWHDPGHRLAGLTHPYEAARNADEDFVLTHKERLIIQRHMFPLHPLPPTSREGWIVTTADKLCAIRETLGPRVGYAHLPGWLRHLGA